MKIPTKVITSFLPQNFSLSVLTIINKVKEYGFLQQVFMKKRNPISEIKAFTVTGLAVISFSQFVMVLFGQTIPNVVWSFFKDAGAALIVASVFLFAVIWFLKSRQKTRPKNYTVMCYDVFGRESLIDGLRTNFTTHDVAWSFMKQYKKTYPLYNFALVSQLPNSSRKTIFKYI